VRTTRVLGLDRSGPEPPQTRAGQPLRPWTLPNVVGYLRLALIPLFLYLALESGDGRTAEATVVFAVVAGSDYVDGLLARLTGQYSRLGALLDPLADRLIVLAGAGVCWHFELLPRWALAALVGREIVTLALVELGLRRGLDLKINWWGRLAIWPILAGIFFALALETWVSEALLLSGLGLALAATAVYVRDGRRQLQLAAPAQPSSST
jgi:cardiolipin synthase (CMP-forming)